jgi:hypothetical protein
MLTAQEFVDDLYGPGWRVINWANPNRLGLVVRIEKDGAYIVVAEDSDGDPEPAAELETCYEGLSQTWFKELAEERRNTPNWEAQEEYDSLWGPPLEFPEY